MRKLFIIVIILIIQLQVLCNTAYNFYFKKFQVENGLSENTVTCLMQDNKGFLWIGTKDGLNKFDGTNFKIYRKNTNPLSLGNNFIKDIAETGNNTMYIATDNGLYIMDCINETFERIEKKLNIEDNIITSVTSIIIDNNNNVWITTMNQGVYLFNPEKIELLRVKLKNYDLRQTSIWSIYQDKAGVIWVGSRIGLLQYNPASGMFETVEGLVEFGNNFSKEILSIFEDPHGNLYLGTWANGILFFNKQQTKHLTYCGPTSNNYYITHIRTFLQFDANNILVGADDGLYMFNTVTKNTSRVDIPYNRYSLSDQNVYSLLRDHEGGIWAGTYFGGLNYLNTSALGFEKHLPNDKPGYMSGKAVSQFCEDPNGNLWIATEDGGLNYFNTKTKIFSQPVKTTYHNIHPLLLAGNKLWIGTFSRGIDVYDTITKQIKNYQNSTNFNSINDNCIFSLYQTRDKQIYIGTTAGLNLYNKTTDNFTRIKPDSLKFIYDIIEDSYLNLWVASYNNGIAKKDAKTGKWVFYNNQLNENDPMFNSKLTGLFIDNTKRLWITSEGRGLFYYNYQTDSFTNISENNGLPNNVVYGVLDDMYGNIWVSSNTGLVTFNPDNITNKTVFTQADGLQSNEFNYKSFFKSSDGKLYFGGINGFNCFYPKNINQNINTSIPNVEITNIDLLGPNNIQTQKNIIYALNSKNTVKLKHYNASFTIHFVSLSFMAQSKNQYAYMLKGTDTHYNHIGNNNNVTYVNLSPGKYTFKVKASNNNGVWNNTGAQIDIEILPPFWLSVAAKIFYFIMLWVIISALIIYYVKRNQLKQQKMLKQYKTEQEQKAFKSKIDFFTNIAHEIRTPVSLIKAPLEEIIVSGDGNQSTKNNLALIDKNSQRLNVLINQLLDFRKIDSDDYHVNATKINLTKLITDIYYRFLKTAQHQNINLILSINQNTDIWAITDPDAITKITGNFLTNALKFTNNKIELSLQQNSDNKFCISVADNGIGIPDNFKNRVFEPFYQVLSDKSKAGSGIGLSLVKHLANILDGNVAVTNAKPNGSVFTFTFGNYNIKNYINNNLQLNNDPDTYQTTPPAQKNNVLIVDDNPDMVNFINSSLSPAYNTFTALNAKQALKMLNNNWFNLIITDIMMPDIDGIEFTRQLRDNINYSHIPIVLLSAKTDNITKIQGLNSGADVFIEKPFSMSYLKAQIASLLANRQAIHEAFNRSPLTSYSILTTNKSDQQFIDNLNTEIDKHISDINFSIESLTKKLFISRSNFQRKLKSICGYTPADYLRTYRLKKAAQLLIEQGIRVNEVAFEVGFNSASYFTKCFVKQFGMLPKDFVKNNHQNPL